MVCECECKDCRYTHDDCSCSEGCECLEYD
jgi:hypothetical protein